jgi:predicted ATPase
MEVMVSGHPLQAVTQDLQLHESCQELSLASLSEAAVAAYLAVRLPGHALPAVVVRMIYQHTEGNPLFLVHMVEYLVAQGVLGERHGRWELTVALDAVKVGVPEELRQMLAQQLERLRREEQRVLEAASVAGMEFVAPIVAAALEEDVAAVEEQCEALVRRQHVLRPAGMTVWPDGTLAACYEFAHWLYQHVAYQRLGAVRRVHLHQRIGARLEAAYGKSAGEMAAALAMHFARGLDARRAMQYLRQAGESATRQHAYREAIAHFTHGMEVLTTLPDTPERAQHELNLQLSLGALLAVTRGYGAVDVEEVFMRARLLGQQVGHAPQLFPALFGLWRCYLNRALYQRARELAEHCLALAARVHDAALLLKAHHALAWTLVALGELVLAREHLDQAMILYNPQQHHALAFLYGTDPGVHSLALTTFPLALLGYPAQALQRSHEALTLAQELSHPISLAIALDYAAVLHQLLRQGRAAQARAEAAMTLCHEHGLAFYGALGSILRGWALAKQGQGEAGLAQLRQGLAAYRATGAKVMFPYALTLLAEACGQGGQMQERLAVLTEALAAAATTGECFYEAEQYRLKGEFLRMQADTRREEAEACFRQALAIAHRQQAKLWELRAATSLARLWQQQGKRTEAYELLAPI